MQLEGLCQWKILSTPSGVETATYRLVAQCLDQLCHYVLHQMEYLPVDLSGWELLELAKIRVFFTDKLSEAGCCLETTKGLMLHHCNMISCGVVTRLRAG